MSDDDELEKIRKKRLEQFQKRLVNAKEEETKQKLLEEEKKKNEGETEEAKLKIMKAVLEPDAYIYYETELKSQYPKVAERITSTLIYLISQNQLRSKLSKNDLIVLQRKILGIGPTIKVKFQGDEEAVELSKKLKEEQE